jgi:hypothetical protein
MTTSEWLQSLKVGDEVAVTGRWCERNFIATVSRVTATLIVTDGAELRFQRKTGYEYGSGSSYNRRRILEITDEIRNGLRRNVALKIIERSNWQSMTTDQLERIVAIIEEVSQ